MNGDHQKLFSEHWPGEKSFVGGSEYEPSRFNYWIAEEPYLQPLKGFMLTICREAKHDAAPHHIAIVDHEGVLRGCASCHENQWTRQIHATHSSNFTAILNAEDQRKVDWQLRQVLTSGEQVELSIWFHCAMRSIPMWVELRRIESQLAGMIIWELQ